MLWCGNVDVMLTKPCVKKVFSEPKRKFNRIYTQVPLQSKWVRLSLRFGQDESIFGPHDPHFWCERVSFGSVEHGFGSPKRGFVF